MNISLASAVVIYGALWLSFGAVHSLLAKATVQRHLKPLLSSGYRLAYNLFALLHIGLVMGVGRLLLSDNSFAVMSNTFSTIMLNAMIWTGIVLIFLSLRQYDLGRFSGLTQWRRRNEELPESSIEPLNTNGLNRWVRHPLYTGAFFYLWGNAASPFGLATAMMASAYLVIGAHHEERKLVSIYGDAYRHYQASVPSFLPCKWPSGH